MHPIRWWAESLLELRHDLTVVRAVTVLTGHRDRRARLARHTGEVIKIRDDVGRGGYVGEEREGWSSGGMSAGGEGGGKGETYHPVEFSTAMDVATADDDPNQHSRVVRMVVTKG